MPEPQNVKLKLSNNEIRKYIEVELKKNNLTLLNRVRGTLKRKWAESCGCSEADVDYSLHSLRKKNGAHPNLLNNNYLREFRQATETGLYNYCLQHGLERRTPQFERESILKMIDRIETLSPGGKGAIFGTPNVVAYSSKSFHLCFDNLLVAFSLHRKTKKGIDVYLGNGVNPKKTDEKAKLWKTVFDLPDSRIFVDTVDSEFFRNQVNEIAKEQKFLGSLAIIVLLTSGVWCCTTPTFNKWNLDLNFEEPSKELTNQYDNLHILAMTRSSLQVNPYGFEVLHLHNGKTEVVE